MMFIVTRTSDRYLYYGDKKPYEKCIQIGASVVRHLPVWGIELNTADDIVRFSKETKSEIIISDVQDYWKTHFTLDEPYCNQEGMFMIEIYDDYRE